jgi:hypothetical protein
MNIITESHKLSLYLLPKAKKNRTSKNKFFHFAFGYHGSRLLGIGQNIPDKTNTQAVKLTRRFNLDNKYPFLHAETDLISRLWHKYYIDSDLSVVIVRLNKNGKLRNSKPCEKCMKILQALDINKIFWSTEDGFKK